MVSWNEQCIVRFREFEYEDNDVQRAWYSEEEIQSFKEERKVIRNLVKKFSSLEVYERTMGNLHSCRGLEKYISRSKAAQRRDQIQLALLLVRSAQANHRLNPNPAMNADEIISQAYQKVTKTCEKEALARGLMYMAWNNDNGEQQGSNKKKELTNESVALKLDRNKRTSSSHQSTITSIMSCREQRMVVPPTTEEGNISLLVSFLSFSKANTKTRS